MLAIAGGDRSDRALHPSQVAGGDHPPYARRGNERAWKDHFWAVLTLAVAQAQADATRSGDEADHCE